MTDNTALLHEGMLVEHLKEMARLKAAKKELDAEIERHQAEAMPLLSEVGSLVFHDPVTGKPQVANVRQAQRLHVDAGDLLNALIEQYGGDVEAAEVIWRDCLKPPEVDVKEEGLLEQAMTPTDVEDPHSARVWQETFVKVATFKPSKAFIGFAKPGG